MKLSTCQFNQIQSYLSKGNIYYTDIKEELVDHFASKVEDAMDEGISFDQAFSEVSKEIKPSRFQRRILLASHLGFLKAIFSNMSKGTIILKSLALFSCSLLLIYFFDYNPIEAETHIKTVFISMILGMVILGLWGGLLKNSQLLSAGNTLWLSLCALQFILNLDWLVWLGLSPLSAVYLIAFLLSLLFIAGFSEVVSQTKKLRTT